MGRRKAEATERRERKRSFILLTMIALRFSPRPTTPRFWEIALSAHGSPTSATRKCPLFVLLGRLPPHE